MRPFPYLSVFFALASSACLWHYAQQQDALQQLRTQALKGQRSAIRALVETDDYIIPYERCAWALLLAERDSGAPVDVATLPVCTREILPEGFYLARDYAALLSSKITYH